MAEEKFYFEHGVNANSAFAGKIVRNIQLAEEALQVKLTARDAWVLVEGGEEECERALGFLEELNRRSGETRIIQPDFEQLLKAFRDHHEGDLQKLYAGKIVVGPKHKEIMPRSLAQLKYLQAMREKEVVFGIGPAGTGKT